MISVCSPTLAEEAPKPPKPNNAESDARAAYEAARKVVNEASAAVAPLRDAVKKADAANAKAQETANAKRQKAESAKKLAGEQGASELKQAKDTLNNTIVTLENATKAKPALDKAVTDARAAVGPLMKTYEAAEKAAEETMAKARAASDAANRLDLEARRATEKADTLRRAIPAAKAAAEQARQNEPGLQKQADAAAKELADATNRKKAADQALAKAKQQITAATQAVPKAEKEAAAADAKAKAKDLPAEEKKKATADAAAKRQAVKKAKAALAKAQAAPKNLQKQVEAAAKKLPLAKKENSTAAAALARAKKAMTAVPQVAQAAEEAAKIAAPKTQAAAQTAARRKPVRDAAAALAQTERRKQQAQARLAAANKKLNEAQAQKKPADQALAKARQQAVAAAKKAETTNQAAQAAEAKAKQATEEPAKKQATADATAKRKAANAAKAALAKVQQAEKAAQTKVQAPAQKVIAAQAPKKAAEQALAQATAKLAPAAQALQAAREAAKDLVSLDDAAKQAATEAAAKRKAASEAKKAVEPKENALYQAVTKANAGAQNTTRTEQQLKAAEEALASLRKRIDAAKQSLAADQQAAKQAEAAAAPLKAEADKARAAYNAATKGVEEKRALARQAKAKLYRLVAGPRLANLMESPDLPAPANQIDNCVFPKLASMGIKPALCSDAVFVRRAYLDLTGKLPTAEVAKSFIQNPDKNKRVALVDQLLGQTAHANYWAMKWSDILRIKAEFPVKVWPNAAQAYHRWVWESVAKNKPYDQFARELLTSSGSNFRVGPVNFYRAIQDNTPEGIANAVGLALMGTRTHAWPEDRRAGMAAFFSQVGFKPTAEWKEEIVFWDPLKSAQIPGSVAPGQAAIDKSVTATNQIPQALEKPLSENGPLEAVFPDGSRTTVPPDRDPREAFADWLIRPDNPWFAKAVANRTWAWAMGRGIIHEPDDIRDDNPPGNPELLACLEKELIKSGYDLKHLKRLIFTSTTYQLSSVARFKERPEAEANFASYPLRRLEAEVLIDAVNKITGTSDLYTSAVPEPFTYIPKDMQAVELADGSVSSTFLTLFGRSARATGMENERINELASSQWLYMLNSGAIQEKLQNGPKLKALISAGGKPEEIAERLYLAILSRFPTEADVKAAADHAKTGVSKGNDVWIDLAWALVNSPEFLMRH